MTGLATGTFDLLHAGHVVFLRDCRRQCDKLVVALQQDPTHDRPYKNKPIQTLLERQIQLMGCKYVDDVVCYETESDLVDLLATMNIDRRFIGDDWNINNITGKEICDSRKIELILIKRDHNWSSTELRERIKNA